MSGDLEKWLHGVAERLISERAHEIWIREGRPEGRALEHWLEAEMEVGLQMIVMEHAMEQKAGKKVKHVKTEKAKNEKVHVRPVSNMGTFGTTYHAKAQG